MPKPDLSGDWAQVGHHQMQEKAGLTASLPRVLWWQEGQEQPCHMQGQHRKQHQAWVDGALLQLPRMNML